MSASPRIAANDDAHAYVSRSHPAERAVRTLRTRMPRWVVDRAGTAGAQDGHVVTVGGDPRVDLLAVPGDAALRLRHLQRTDDVDLHVPAWHRLLTSVIHRDRSILEGRRPVVDLRSVRGAARSGGAGSVGSEVLAQLAGGAALGGARRRMVDPVVAQRRERNQGGDVGGVDLARDAQPGAVCVERRFHRIGERRPRRRALRRRPAGGGRDRWPVRT